MQNRPVTPMRDASLVRLMDAQARGKTGLVAYPDMVRGAAHVRGCLEALRSAGFRYVVADGVDDAQLAVLAEACAGFRLLTGGSGLAAKRPASPRHPGIDGFHIGRCIAPGVPWLRVLDDDVFPALKSGNFGTGDFFILQGQDIRYLTENEINDLKNRGK